jgi:hypothetical protein
MTVDAMRTFADGKLGLTVVALKDGGAVFQVKLDAHTQKTHVQKRSIHTFQKTRTESVAAVPSARMGYQTHV